MQPFGAGSSAMAAVRTSGGVGSPSFLTESLASGAESLPPEVEEGNVEYKLKLVRPPPERLQHLISQLKWRLAEGSGEAMYEIGVSDNGSLVGLSPSDMEASLSTLKRMGAALRADMSLVRQRPVVKGRFVAEVLFRKGPSDDQHFLEIRVAILGGLDAGKSTLLGVLTHSITDNGRGKARLNLLRHRHEIETGRTSSISHQIIGFDAQGELVNYASTNISSWDQICENSAKIVTFLDLCGHPKYQKTTISGLTGTAPDYACLIVGANAGDLSDVCREHLGISVILNMPIFVVVTKVDIATPEQLTWTIQALLAQLQTPGVCKMPLVIQSEDDLVACVSDFVSSRIVPIFLTSSVTGENMDLLIKFFNILPRPPRNFEELLEEETEYQVEEVYSVPHVGCVVGGIVASGRMHLSGGQPITLYLGPDRGKFILVRVHSLHRQRCSVKHVQAGQAATCALIFPPLQTLAAAGSDAMAVLSTSAGSNQSNNIVAPSVYASSFSSVPSESWLDAPPPGFRLRRGQVLVTTPSLSTLPHAFWEFDADINVLYHASSLATGSQGIVYCGSLRQGVRIMWIVPSSPMATPTQANRGTNSDKMPSMPASSNLISPQQQRLSSTPLSPSMRAARTSLSASPTMPPTLELGQMQLSGSLESQRHRSASRSHSVTHEGRAVPAEASASPLPSRRRRRRSSQSPAMNARTSSDDPSPSPCMPTPRTATTATNAPDIADGMWPLDEDVSAVPTIPSGPPSGTSTLATSTNDLSAHPSTMTLPLPTTPSIHTKRRSMGTSTSPAPPPSATTPFGDTSLILSTGDRGRVRFRFAYEPEYLVVGRTVLFRDTNGMKCVGKIVSVAQPCLSPSSFPHADDDLIRD